MITHRWAAEAFSAAFTLSFCALRHSTREELGVVTALRYGSGCPGMPYPVELIAYDSPAGEVDRAARACRLRPGERALLNVFHDAADAARVRAEYAARGCAYQYTNAVLGKPLPAQPLALAGVVREVASPAQVDFVNATLGAHQPMQREVVDDPARIRAYYVELDGQAVGWATLVMAYPEAAYLADLFTLPAYRRQGVARALIGHRQAVASALGNRHAILVPSFYAWRYFQQYGYEPLVSFSAFELPKGGGMA